MHRLASENLGEFAFPIDRFQHIPKKTNSTSNEDVLNPGIVKWIEVTEGNHIRVRLGRSKQREGILYVYFLFVYSRSIP